MHSKRILNLNLILILIPKSFVNTGLEWGSISSPLCPSGIFMAALRLLCSYLDICKPKQISPVNNGLQSVCAVVLCIDSLWTLSRQYISANMLLSSLHLHTIDSCWRSITTFVRSNTTLNRVLDNQLIHMSLIFNLYFLTKIQTRHISLWLFENKVLYTSQFPEYLLYSKKVCLSVQIA